MRRLLAFIFILALAAVALDGPLFCADGCDRSDTARQTPRAPCESCVTCQSGSLPEACIDVTPLLRLIDVLVRDHFASLPPRSNAIEHPPRAA